jgi:hypothetical protein
VGSGVGVGVGWRHQGPARCGRPSRTTGRWEVATQGGRATVEAAPGDSWRRAVAGTTGIGRAMGDEWRGPGVAPSRVEGASGLGGRCGAGSVTRTGMMVAATMVRHGRGVGSRGGLIFFEVWKGYCVARGERRCRRWYEILTNVSYDQVHSSVNR